MNSEEDGSLIEAVFDGRPSRHIRSMALGITSQTKYVSLWLLRVVDEELEAPDRSSGKRRDQNPYWWSLSSH